MEYKTEADFVCDTVSYQDRVRYEKRKGKYKAAMGGMVILMSVGILLLRIFQVLHTGYFSWRQVVYDIVLFIIGVGLLYATTKWQGSRLKREYGRRIQSKEKSCFSGTFYPEFLLIETKEGEKHWYYYNDISHVEETEERFHITGEKGRLDIPKMYLSRDDMRSVRHQLMRYCKSCYVQSFKEETENFRLDIRPDTELSAELAQKERKAYFSYAGYMRQTYFTEARVCVIGGSLFYIFLLAILGNEEVSRIGKTGCAIMMLAVIFMHAVQSFIVWRSWKKAQKRKQSGMEMRLEIRKDGCFFRAEDLHIRKSWKQIKQIYEGKDFFAIGNIYVGKTGISEENIGKLRVILQRYAGRNYHFIEIKREGFRGTWKMLLPIFVYGVIILVVLTGYKYVRDEGQKQAAEYGGEQENFDVFQTEEKQHTKTAKKQPVYVLTPDKNSLRLTMTDINISDCYSFNEINEESRFYIGAEEILYGASANHNGELGLGNTQEYLTAKGFYREMEVARNVKHVALGEDFMVFLNIENELIGTGNLPSVGNSDTPVLLMKDVQYVKCSDAGIVALKQDGSVWCAGTLYDEAGNTIHSYDGFEQVLDHVSFVTAGRHAMAAIGTDGSLWMWGDNTKQQCGVSSKVTMVMEEPTIVKENVRMVWIDRLAFSSNCECQGYLLEEPDPYVTNRTYILTEDGNTYACGEGMESNEAFVSVEIIEE